ncbi:BON domain-containing protein [Janthinobacterium agaricidamnosum]|uniref:Putative phospholipid-binding domain protein n=1 Tax=Janthinobacterium agaricidamnosum NBRC 102515 = DSM 9628 TaxID=1349767 RepID=W0VFC7_9BURK|nr:BON domain-containing protein [Janthinobacterium agaricidamnosum]CDG86067.1 putative phospholipid-binding domain protein [Janthinobacterium agaricidamnosum NBRC 102515 = DSM 9628]
MTDPGTRWSRLKRPLSTALLCGAMASTLTGCFGLVVGGAVMGGVAVADRRTLGAQTEDKAIALKGESRIPAIVGEAGHVNVTSFNRRVLLTGEVRDEAMKAAVEREARSIEGVESIANELEIAGPSSYTSRSSDTLVTGKVKASLVDMKTISASSFKVVTERGTVYLMGRVTQREGTVATDVTRGISGVQKVVKLFDYISEEELKQLQAEPQKTANSGSASSASN